ncbi:hypothetical protein [Rhodococcus sp. WB1]|uniref:hypothetical protein n=1 Tax=Rhodococcus sp. WB1 TaxID=1033922 RepID=UPI0012F4D8C7|nr:hypothetical protein [Rhodococcus sp. WB1]
MQEVAGSFEKDAQLDVGVRGSDVRDDLVPAPMFAHELHRDRAGCGAHFPHECHRPNATARTYPLSVPIGFRGITKAQVTSLPSFLPASNVLTQDALTGRLPDVLLLLDLDLDLDEIDRPR